MSLHETIAISPRSACLRIFLFAGILAVFGALGPLSAGAGVFNLPRFVEPGKNAVGVEPEVVVTNGGGVAGNLRYAHGLTDLMDGTAIIGTGTGVRNFRVGGALTFDFFPDVDQQPGIGIATQAIYYRYKYGYGQLETTGIPYIHKRFFDPAGNVVEPYFALPFGPAFHQGHYQWQTQVVLGALFNRAKTDVHFVGEVGVNVNKAESYISGGVLFQPKD